jgi:hypothetical protein
MVVSFGDLYTAFCSYVANVICKMLQNIQFLNSLVRIFQFDPKDKNKMHIHEVIK